VSFYGRSFQGRKTANGESFDANALTMAHRTLPFDTLVKVTHLKTKKSVIVRVNDRGPFTKGRIGDLSYAAAQQIGMVHRGLAKVSLSVVKIP
jgi:rare lipoprotein A